MLPYWTGWYLENFLKPPLIGKKAGLPVLCGVSCGSMLSRIPHQEGPCDTILSGLPLYLNVAPGTSSQM